MPNQGTFVLRWFFSLIRDWGWIILVCIILGGVAGAIITSQMPPIYATSAVLYVEPSKESLTNEYNAIIAAERLASTYSEMLKSKAILEEVIEELDLNISVGALAKQITTQTIPATQLVKVTVENQSPEKAAAIANALTRKFVSFIHATQSEVYAPGLSNMQTDLQTYDEKITSTQAKIDDLYASEIRVTDELTQLETSLAETQTDIRLLQDDKRANELLVEQVTDFIQVFQPAAVPETRPLLPYKATVLLLVRQELASGYIDYSSILASERLTQTYSQILQSQVVLQKAIDRLELTQNVDTIQRMVDVDPIADTQLIQLSVTSTNVDFAVLLANTIADEFINHIQGSVAEPYIRRLEKVENSLTDLQTKQEEIQQSITDLSATRVNAEIEISYLERVQTTDRASRLEIEDDYERMEQLSRDSAESVYVTEIARIPESPSTSPVLYIGLAILMGALIGTVGALILDNQDDTIRTADDTAKEVGVNILGKLNYMKSSGANPAVLSSPLSPISEAFLITAHNISFATSKQPAKVILVTSPSPAEGKSFVVANLAVTLARLGKKVIAVDADLRRPDLHRLFDIEQENGLADALMEGAIKQRVYETKIDGLKILPSGKTPVSPLEVMSSVKMQGLLQSLSDQADIVLIDCPPVLPVADASMLASIVDGVILVVRANYTRGHTVREALQHLNQTGTKVIGVVLNAIPSSTGYYYHPGDEGRAKPAVKNWFAFKPNWKVILNLRRFFLRKQTDKGVDQ